jgi:hypothetical protein
MSFSFNFMSNEEPSEAGMSSSSWLQKVQSQCAAGHALEQIPRPKSSKLFVKRFTLNGIKFRRLADVGEHEIDGESDLIPGIYGGGLKIWECTLDLMKFLIEQQQSLPSRDAKVLELGCGHGFPGVVAMTLGYQEITFLDLNVEVIQDATWPTIIANKSDQTNMEAITCLAGDWLALSTLCKER